MPKATERWSDRQFVPFESAQRAWDVVECEHEGDVYNAVQNEFNVERQISTHPLDFRMRAGNPTITAVAPGGRMWKYVMPYGFGGGGVSGALDLPPLLEWHQGNESAPAVSDFYGNALVNAAGEVTDEPPDIIPTGHLTIRRWESSHDLSRDFQYADSINEDGFSLFGRWQIEPGQCYCHGINPAEAYKIGTSPQIILYRLELRGGKVKDGDGLWDGFKSRTLNAGRRGWYGDPPRPGYFTIDGQLVSEPVLLDGTGMPWDVNVKCGGKQPVGNPTPLPTNVYLEPGAGNVLYIKRQRKKLRPFLNLFN
jgi:hypothetical protein